MGTRHLLPWRRSRRRCLCRRMRRCCSLIFFCSSTDAPALAAIAAAASGVAADKIARLVADSRASCLTFCRSVAGFFSSLLYCALLVASRYNAASSRLARLISLAFAFSFVLFLHLANNFMICSMTERRMRSSELECHLTFRELVCPFLCEADLESPDLDFAAPVFLFPTGSTALLRASAASLASLVARLGRVI